MNEFFKIFVTIIIMDYNNLVLIFQKLYYFMLILIKLNYIHTYYQYIHLFNYINQAITYFNHIIIG